MSQAGGVVFAGAPMRSGVMKDPYERQLPVTAGLIFGGAVSAHKACPSIFKSPESAKKSMQRCGTWRPPQHLAEICFRRARRGVRPETAWVDPAYVPDARAAVEKLVGPLDWLEFQVDRRIVPHVCEAQCPEPVEPIVPDTEINAVPHIEACPSKSVGAEEIDREPEMDSFDLFLAEYAEEVAVHGDAQSAARSGDEGPRGNETAPR